MRVITPSDDHLLDLLRSGDRQAFERLYNRYWSKLYIWAYNVLRDKQAAEDVVQEVLVQLWIRRETVVIDRLSAYLYTAVRYQVFNTIKQGRTVCTPVETLAALPATNKTESLVEEKELRLALSECVKQLPEKCREIYMLSRHNHLSNREIATLLSIAPKTVENQLTIALRRLRLSVKDFFLWIMLAAFFC